MPMALIGVLLYYVGTDRVGTEVNKSHQAQLQQSIQQMDDYLSNLEKFVVRVAFDPVFDESLNHFDFTDQFQKTKDLMKSLTLMTESNALLSSVCLYLRDADKLVCDDAGIRQIQTDEDRKLFAALLDEEKPIYWNYGIKQIHKPDLSYKAVVIKLPGGQLQNAFGAFLVYLDPVKLNAMVQKLVSGEGISFLINEHGDYLTDLRSSPTLPTEELLENKLRARIMEENLKENTFIYDWKNESYSVSYGKIAKLGGKWTVVSATPLSQITAPVTSISRMIIGISLFALLTGLLLAWFASNRIYDPISRLKSMFETGITKADDNNEISYIENQWKEHLQEQQALRTRVQQSIPTLRESFLLQFLQGNLYTHTELEINEKMNQLEWDIENKKFAFWVAQLQGLSDLAGTYSERDAQLITFAASNIMLELSSQKLPMVHIMNFQDLSVGAFFVLDSEGTNEQLKAELNRSAEDYIAALNNVLRIKATMVISTITNSVLEAPNVLEQTRRALRFRELHSSNQLLDMGHFILENNERVPFPFELEREIVQAIGMGLEEEAVRLVEAFLVALQQNNNTELMVHQGMMKLLGTIHDTIMKYDVNMYALYEGAHLYEELVQITETNAMVHWFQYKLIQPFIRTLSIAYDSGLRRSIEQLIGQIGRDFLSDISLEAYAEQLQMSSSKLSKVFKQITGVNYIDYITRLRIEKCKELLYTTDLKINDIAELLRYQPSYLIRIFKKSEGMTPGQYREKHSHE
ncbi:helix-turn-helix domain-containing protein [Paenibacillus agricola]|uniref:Helix-turn-helix domain-containing protein n=1 Tax=Paenibacillus agricola TaxID=2716264 RepID=A0ABX0JH08_9BACL|nr:helix-turn-helix domain-containing protein [Paenibacillus agricola]NHN32970.1 helix-turn-helix domain-containing protein [Paenibacillus agricola]